MKTPWTPLENRGTQVGAFMNNSDSKTISLADINKQVPDLNHLFQDITQIRFQLKYLYAKLEKAGVAPDDIQNDNQTHLALPNDQLRDFVVFQGLLDTLRDWILLVEEHGCKVTDVEQGVCEFDAEIDEQKIKLSWRFGEREILYWHERHQKFADRKMIETLAISKTSAFSAQLI